LVERLIRNQQVAGSIPAGGSRKIHEIWHSLEIENPNLVFNSPRKRLEKGF
jgi:hypothetical protein